MIRLPHGLFIPERVTDEPLHRPDLAPFHAECHRLNRLPFQGTELAHHIIEKLVPRFLPSKTGPKSGVEPAEFVHVRVDIAHPERYRHVHGRTPRVPHRFSGLFLPSKTGPKSGVEPAEFVHERVDIALGERKLGNGKRLVCRPTSRQHLLPPGTVLSKSK